MRANGIHPSGGATTPPTGGSSKPTQKNSARNSRVPVKKRRLDDGSPGYFCNDDNDENDAESKPKPESIVDSSQELGWKPKQGTQWQPRSEPQWHPLTNPQWHPKSVPHWQSRPGPQWTKQWGGWHPIPPQSNWQPSMSAYPAYHQHDSENVYQLPNAPIVPQHPLPEQQSPLPQRNRYRTQTDADGNNSIVLNAGCDSIFGDFFVPEVFDPSTFADPTGQPQSQSSNSQREHSAVREAEEGMIPEVTAQKSPPPTTATMPTQTTPAIHEQKVEDTPSSEQRHASESSLVRPVQENATQVNPHASEPVSIVIHD